MAGPGPKRVPGDAQAVRTPDAVDVHVGARVRDERVRAGLTQTDLGLAIGVTFQQVQKYERGTNRVSASMLVRVADALSIEVGELFPSSADREGHPDRRGASVRVHLELAEAFNRLDPRQRQLVVNLARQLARPADAG